MPEVDLSSLVQGSRVLIIEDMRPFQNTLRDASAFLGWQVVGCTDNVEDARRLFFAEKPDVVLLDLRLPLKPGDRMREMQNGVDLLEEFSPKKVEHKLTIIIFSASSVEQWALRRAAEIPVSFIVKEDSDDPVALQTALALASRGAIIFDREASRYLPAILGKRKTLDELSGRVRETVKYYAEGRTISEIAEMMNIVDSTVRSHLDKAKETWGITSAGYQGLVAEYFKRQSESEHIR